MKCTGASPNNGIDPSLGIPPSIYVNQPLHPPPQNQKHKASDAVGASGLNNWRQHSGSQNQPFLGV
jgi:hypothetical protein